MRHKVVMHVENHSHNRESSKFTKGHVSHVKNRSLVNWRLHGERYIDVDGFRGNGRNLHRFTTIQHCPVVSESVEG